MAGLFRKPDSEVQINAQFGTALVNTTALDQTAPVGLLFAQGQGAVIYQDPFDPNPLDIDIQANFLSATTFRPTGVQIAPPGLGFSGLVDLNPQAAVLVDSADPGIARNRALVVWSQGGDIFGRLINAAGDTLTNAPVPVFVAAGLQQFPDVAALAGGRSVVVWENAALGQIGGLVLGADGQQVAVPAFRIDTAGGTRPVVARLGDERFVVAWVGADVAGAGLHARIFDARTGAALGNELGTAANPLNVSTTLDQTQPAIVALSNGNFAIAWTDASTRVDAGGRGDFSASGVKVRVFDANGVAVTGELLANTSTGGVQDSPAITAGPNGGFVVAWTDQSGEGSVGNVDASGKGIKAQAFSAAGVRIGDELLVNRITAGDQDHVSLTTGADGTILAVFEDSSRQVDGSGQTADAGGFGIQAVRLAVDVTPPTVSLTNVGGPTRVAVQTISGTVGAEDAGVTVRILEGTTQVATAVAGADGAFSASVTLSGQGQHVLSASATDLAGNTGTSAAVTFTLDTVAPTVAITSAGGQVRAGAVTIMGTVGAADAGTTVRVLDGATLIGTATVAADGRWSVGVTLGVGSHTITAQDTDAAGNVGTSAAVLFTATGATPVAQADVFRFFNTTVGGHFFTRDVGERDTVRGTRSDLNFEGAKFKAFIDDDVDGTVAVFRFFNTNTGGHFFTRDVGEKDGLLTSRPDLRFEGVKFYEFAAAQADAAPVYRFFNTKDGGHFYTSNEGERAAVLATRADLKAEGIGFYAPIGDFFV